MNTYFNILKSIFTILILSTLLYSCTGETTEKQHEIVKSKDAKTLMAESFESFTGFWNSGDALAVAGEFTDDAVRVISNSTEPIVGGEAIKNSFVATFSEDSDLKNSHINVTVSETRLLSDTILIWAGTYKILDANNTTLETGKWGNVWQYKNGKVKCLLESAHSDFKDTDTSTKELVALNKSIVSDELHFDKIEASVAGYIKHLNEKNADSLSKLFTENALQNVSSKDGIVVGRENIKATEIFLDGQILDANILGYRYLGDSLAIGYGNWTQLDKTTNSMVRGQWGNIFKIDGNTAYLEMESAGLSK